MGTGLSIATELAKRESGEKVYVVDKAPFADEFYIDKFETFQFDLTNEDYSFFDQFNEINALMITAGFGILSLFNDVLESHIIMSFNVNTITVLRLVHKFYGKLEAHDDFYCGVMVSIAGFMPSPFFAVYGATKAALKIFNESVNVELKRGGSLNQILNVSSGSLKGTSFTAGKMDLSVTAPMINTIIKHLEIKDDLFILQYEDISKNVLERYHVDFKADGEHSYDYKLNS